MEGDIGSANDGFYNPKVKKYPLSVVTPVSVYRQHSSNDNNPFMREDVYRHGVWISGVDAQARGIKDGDLCRVYSDRGEAILPGTSPIAACPAPRPSTMAPGTRPTARTPR